MAAPRPNEPHPEEERGAPRGFTPTARLAADVRPPGSKSIAQRVMACALLAEGTTVLDGLPSGRDVLAALRCARAGGASFPSDAKPDDLLATALIARGAPGRIVGAPAAANERARPWATFPVGESGTSARLFAAIAALARPPESGAEIVPEGTLQRRTSPALFTALASAGVGIQHARGSAPHSFAVSLTAAAPRSALELHHPVSSQEVSALLVALAAGATRHELIVVGDIPSRPYVDLTAAILAAFGVHVASEEVQSDGHGHGGTRFSVHGPLYAPEGGLRVETDASSAAVALGAGAITGQPVSVAGVGTGSLQPDARALIEALTAAGCDLSGSHSGALAVTGRAHNGIEFDCTGCPDLAPVLAAIGAYTARAHGRASRLTGLATLPGKESSRIDVLARGLDALGFAVDATDHSLGIGPGPRDHAAGIVLDPAGDHRMAFAFALISLFEPEVRVADPDCVSKSWPLFWDDLLRCDD